MSNTLKEVRVREGLSQSELARLAGTVDRTIQRAEDGERVRDITKSKIVNALNRRPSRLAVYSVEDLFKD